MAVEASPRGYDGTWDQGPGTSLHGYGGNWGGQSAQQAPGTTGGSPSSPPPAPKPPTPTGTPTAKTSAYDILATYFKSWGMDVTTDLSDILNKMLAQGYGPNDVQLFLPDIEKTTAFQKRFPGWSQRVANGYNQLSDLSQYTQLEDQYRSIMQSAGLPSGFYDDPSDYAHWIANDVSPNEIQTRVGDAVTLAQQVDPTMRNLMSKYYGLTTGDVASYFLDSSRALPTIQRQFDAAQLATSAAHAGLDTSSATRYEDLLDKGVTASQAAQGYSTVAALKDSVGKIAGVYGDSFDQTDAENDVFFNDSTKRNRLVSNEKGQFSGNGRAQNTGTASRQAY